MTDLEKQAIVALFGVEGCRKILQEVAAIQASLPSHIGWIDVEAKLPEENQWILFCRRGTGPAEKGILLDGEFVLPDLGYLKRKVTHWMPLPDPPESE